MEHVEQGGRMDAMDHTDSAVDHAKSSTDPVFVEEQAHLSETHAKLDRVLEVEQGLPLDEWIPELVASAEPHDYRCPAVNYKKLNRQ